MNTKTQKAYEVVIKDLKKSLQCLDKDYSIGCFSCGLRLVYKTLKSFYDCEKVNAQAVYKKRKKKV